MNITAVLRALESVQDLDPAAKLAVVAVAARCRNRDEYVARISLRNLARDLGMASKASAWKATQRAVDAGYLAVENAGQNGTAYRLAGLPSGNGGVSPGARGVSPGKRNRTPGATPIEKRSIESGARRRRAAERPSASAVDKAPPEVAGDPPHGLSDSVAAVLEGLSSNGTTPSGQAGIAAARKALRKTDKIIPLKPEKP